MLETLGVIASFLFVIFLIVFGLRLLVYIISGGYTIDQRIDRFCK